MAEVAKTVISESVLKKQKREEQWALAKKEALVEKKKKDRENRKLIFSRGQQYAKEYENQEKELIQLKREARLKGAFYVSPEAKLLFIIRIHGKRAALSLPRHQTLLFILNLVSEKRVEHTRQIQLDRKKDLEIKEKFAAGEDVDEMIANGKSHGPEWLKGRQGKKAGLASSLAPTDPFLEDLTAKIRADLEVELEAKANRIVQKNMSKLLQRLAEANPDLNLDLGDFCASEDGENVTPLTGFRYFFP